MPGNGDTITMNHDLTVDANAIIGTSPSDQTTYVITGANDKRLTVAAGITLTVRGNAKFQRAGGVTLSADSTWKFDASQASVTSTQYFLDLNNAFSGEGVMTFNGSSGSPCVVTSDAGGGNIEQGKRDGWGVSKVRGEVIALFDENDRTKLLPFAKRHLAAGRSVGLWVSAMMEDGVSLAELED